MALDKTRSLGSILPEVILADASGMQSTPSLYAPYLASEPTSSGEAQWSYDGSSAVVSLNYTSAPEGLLSATIYARSFEDDTLRYSC